MYIYCIYTCIVMYIYTYIRRIVMLFRNAILFQCFVIVSILDAYDLYSSLSNNTLTEVRWFEFLFGFFRFICCNYVTLWSCVSVFCWQLGGCLGVFLQVQFAPINKFALIYDYAQFIDILYGAISAPCSLLSFLIFFLQLFTSRV